MALVVTIAGVNRTSLIETDTIRISQVADSFTFTAQLSLYDEDGDVAITAGSHQVADEITIVDGATTYFGGYVVNLDTEAAEDGSRHLRLQCQGYGIRLNEVLVELEEYSNKADDWLINDLFDTYLAAFDSVTHVAQIDAGMDIGFEEMTLAEIMNALCERTKGRWYIDNDKKVHYFAAEADAVAWFLSDTPEAATENLITNPSIETNTTGWTATGSTFVRSADNAKFGDYSGKLLSSDGGGLGRTHTSFAATDTKTYTASVWIKAVAGASDVAIYFSGAVVASPAYYSGSGDWERITITATATATAAGYLTIRDYRAADWLAVYVDGVQIEEKAAATSCCIGGRAGCTWQGAAHGSKSDRIISYSYFNDPVKRVDAAAIVNRVRVIGADGFAAARAVTRNDATSQALYGIRAAAVTDPSLESVEAMEERGDDVLDKNKDPRVTFAVKTFQDGAVAGQDIGFRCPDLDIDEDKTIRELNITWWMNEPSYELALGTHANTSAFSRAFDTGSAIRDGIISPSVPVSAMGWSHDIEFLATDYRTIKWVDGGDITLAGGVETYAIGAGAGNSTGNMAAVTFVYLDTAISITALQVTDSAATAVGRNKILVCVAGPVADEDTNLAIFQVFGGAGTGVLIVADNIAADTITGNEIHANAINAGHIVAAAVETDKIKAGAVVADKLSIGQSFFSETDGLLVLNPPIRIEKVAANNFWHTLRGQKAELGEGALHLESGRWQATKALIVELATTNLMLNPSIEIDTTGWVANSSVISRDTTYARYGVASLKVVTGNVGAAEGTYDIVTAQTAASTEYTFSVWCRGSGTVRAWMWDVGAGYQYGTLTTLTSTWQRFQVMATYGVGADRRVGVFTNAQQDITFYCDGFQLEESDYATTYCDGSLGDGYAWTNGDHASTSTRAVTEVNLDDHVGLVTDNDTLSFRTVIQMPWHTTDGIWPRPLLENYVFHIKGAANNDISLSMKASNWSFVVNGVVRVSDDAGGHAAGAWVDVIVTLDFANDIYTLYVDGLLKCTPNTDVLAAPTLTDWTLGSDTDGANQGCFTFAEYSVFNKTLTAIEVAQLHNLQRPIVDTGAHDKPGIYLLDGMFRIQSSQTGVRIEITPEMIAGYDSAGTAQFYLQASDGKAYAGGGAVRLDEDGLTLVGAESYIWFTDDALNTFALGIIGADGFTISEYVGEAQKGLFRIFWNDGDIDMQLDYNELADTTRIFARSPLIIETATTIEIKATTINATGLLDVSGRVYGSSFSTDDGVIRYEFLAAVGAVPIALLGYFDIKINGATYHVPHMTVP